MMPKFERGNSYGKTGGRPSGVRNRFAADMLRDMRDFWHEPVPGTTLTRGVAMLQRLFRERPHVLLQVFAATMPREMLLESVDTGLTIEEMDALIKDFRERAAAIREENDGVTHVH
jgi:hypothetical protein